MTITLATKKLMTQKKPFSLLHILLLFLLLVCCRVFYYALSDGFTLKRIENTFPLDGLQGPAITLENKEKLRSIFAQPFHYLGKGSQAYCFESQDGQYVLKLFKCYHLQSVDWIKTLPLPKFLDRYRHEQVLRREKKQRTTVASYKIARDILPKECAIIYIQIVPTPHLDQMITFTDKIGRQHAINLGHYGFVVQKKARLVFPVFDELIRDGNEKEATSLINSIVEFMVCRSKKGIQDQDPDLHKNAGVIDGKVYCIDIGGFHENDRIKNKEVMKADIMRFTRRLYNHLKSQNSELSENLAQHLNSEINNI